MRTVKIVLAIVVVAIIGIFITKWLIAVDPPKEIDLPKNQYTKRIESEIDSLRAMPENKFCQKKYNDVKYRINDYFNQGFLGKNESDNKQWKEILSRNLYSAYAPKFVHQAMFVFRHPEWRYEDLKIIREELTVLKKSEFLAQESSISKSFNEISIILMKYDEINSFINKCKLIDNSDFAIESRDFPDVSAQIDQSRAYLSKRMGNVYVNKCSRLKFELANIPKILFDKHVGYLFGKIRIHGATYSSYRSQSSFSSAVFDPLKSQINELDNDVYKLDENEFDIGYNTVFVLLSDFNRDAFRYFKNLN